MPPQNRSSQQPPLPPSQHSTIEYFSFTFQLRFYLDIDRKPPPPPSHGGYDHSHSGSSSSNRPPYGSQRPNHHNNAPPPPNHYQNQPPYPQHHPPSLMHGMPGGEKRPYDSGYDPNANKRPRPTPSASSQQWNNK